MTKPRKRHKNSTANPAWGVVYRSWIKGVVRQNDECRYATKAIRDRKVLSGGKV